MDGFRHEGTRELKELRKLAAVCSLFATRVKTHPDAMTCLKALKGVSGCRFGYPAPLVPIKVEIQDLHEDLFGSDSEDDYSEVD